MPSDQEFSLRPLTDEASAPALVQSAEQVAEEVRARILRGLRAGTLRVGDRLPSARDFAMELGVEHRLVLAALRALSDEGLVELRPRGGLYVASQALAGSTGAPIQELWLSELLSASLARDLSPAELQELIRRSTETLRLRAAVVAETEDQVYGLCRELADDFGFVGESVLAEAIADGRPLPLAVRRADLLVTVPSHADAVRAIGAAHHIRVVVVTLRPDLTTGDLALLLRQPVFAVVASPRFAQMVRRFFADVPGVANLTVLVHGTDDLARIPADAPVYVTQRVRRLLGSALPGKVLPPARTISTASANELFAFIVRENAAALRRHETDR